MALYMRGQQPAFALTGQVWTWWRSLSLGLLLVVLGSLVWAQKGLLPVPALTAQVIDQTGTLSAQQRLQITARLESIERQYGSQIVVLMVDTTAPEDIAAYANRVASDWKIGRKDAGDGLLFIIAKQDRSLRLEVARGLEGTIPDIAAGRIIQSNVVPVLRSGDFAAAIVAGLTAIEARLAGDELLPAPQAAPMPVVQPAPAPTSSGWSTMLDNLFPILFFGVPVVCSILARAIGRPLTMLLIGSGVGVGTLVTTGSWLQALMFAAVAAFIALCASGGGGISSSSSGGWSSGSSSSRSSGRSSSGGFRSGGGGSFGGGGASGKW